MSPPPAAAADDGGPPLPGAREDFTLRPIRRQEVPVWYHAYCTAQHPTRADSFNEGWGRTRFAPLRQADGTPVHTWYAASTVEGALMESLLHDVPLAPPGLFEHAALAHWHLATVQLPDPFTAVSLHTKDLPRLGGGQGRGLTRAQLIDSLPPHYPATRAWAQAAFDQCPAAQGIAWTARRDDAARCVMLFGQRLPAPPFTVLADEPLALGARRAEVLALVRSLRLHEV